MMSLEHNVPAALSFESSTGPKSDVIQYNRIKPCIYRTPPSASGARILHMSLVTPIITLLIWLLVYFFLNVWAEEATRDRMPD